VAECLPSMCEALDLIPSNAKKKKKGGGVWRGRKGRGMAQVVKDQPSKHKP
jgi:hypothetical protein